MARQQEESVELVTVRADDLRSLLEAVDTDYVSTENLPDLFDRIDRLGAAVGLGEEYRG